MMTPFTASNSGGIWPPMVVIDGRGEEDKVTVDTPITRLLVLEPAKCQDIPQALI